MDTSLAISPAGTAAYIIGGGFLNKVNEISIGFTMKVDIDIPTARKILIEMSQDLVARINASEEIRPFLKNYPFKLSNLDYGFLIKNKSASLS